MTSKAKTIDEDASIVETVNLMEAHKITTLAVVDNKQTLLGIIHMHDLLHAKVI